MFLHGYHKLGKHRVGRRLLAERNAASFVVLIALGGLLGYDFSQSVAKQQFEAEVRATLKRELNAYPGVYLTDLRFREESKKEIVTAVLRTPYSFTPDRVAALEAKLPTPKRNSLELHIRSVITKETTRAGYLNEMPQAPSTDQTDTLDP
jgi:hypothetical protein